MRLEARPDVAAELYVRVDCWQDIFSQTIKAAHVIERGVNWVDVEVSHRTAGVVPNTLVFISPTCIGLMESKPLYHGWFRNEFRACDKGTDYVLSGWLVLKAWLRPVTPLVAWWVRRRMAAAMRQFVSVPFAEACIHAS